MKLLSKIASLLIAPKFIQLIYFHHNFIHKVWSIGFNKDWEL
jgi:hypothetical protein